MTTAHFPQNFLLFLPKPWVTVGFCDLKSLFQHKWFCDSKTTPWGHFLQPSLSAPSSTDAVKAWLGTSTVAKSQTLTQIPSGAELVQGSFFPLELLIPQAETETLQHRTEGAGGEGACLRCRKFPVAQKEEDGSLLKSSGSRVKPKGGLLQSI